jgi:predicted metal-dependent phosphotriesterase family hydrolase
MAVSSPRVLTVLGAIDPSSLGPTHAHEHLVAHATPRLVNEQPDLDLSDGEHVAVDLAAFRAAGGGAIVEMTTVDYGRDVAALARLSRRSGVHVVAATGFNKDVYCAPYCTNADPDTLAMTQIAEVTDGVIGTGVRCGVVKFATSLDGPTAAEAIAAHAAAITHRATGCPILTHTEAGTFASGQLELMDRHGVMPTAITLGHLDRNPDLGLHRELAQAGAFLSYDSLPKPKYATEGPAIELLIALARDGLHEQVVVGGDFARRSMFTGWGGGPGLNYILTVFAARLKDAADRAGVDGDDLVDAVLRRNPARALTFRCA